MVEELKKLYARYPWLKITTTVEEYVEPKYYNRLLKDYIFKRKTDLQIFEDFINSAHLKRNTKSLELGCGSGRATAVFIDAMRSKKFELDLVDLSKTMLDFSRKRFNNYKNLKFINSDLLTFLEKTEEVYNMIFSLWSFSHSVHQVLIKNGLREGKTYVKSVIKKMVKNNMRKSSKFFLIHFDSLSDEQKILMRQWKKAFIIYKDLYSQSPSKQIIDEVLQELQDEEIIKFKLYHFEGKAITYYSIDEALEIFLNFHMESYFNESPLLPRIIKELNIYFKKFTDKNGKIKIKPGCFIYEVDKLGK